MDCFWGFGLTGSQLGVSGSGCHLLFCLSGWKELVEGLDVEELANGFALAMKLFSCRVA